LSIIIGYLLGSVLFAHLISRARGVDITKVGTGNPGAANVFREIGKKEGILVFFLDGLKGAIAMLIADKIFHISGFWIIMTGTAVVIGHCLPIFYKFKGGRGVSTLGGVIIYIMPQLFIPGAALYFATRNIKPRKLEYIVDVCALLYFIYLIRVFYRPELSWLSPGLGILLAVSVAVNIKHLTEEFKR
jgi:glycerol-3-phosphate acyltransferase PlsY